MRSAPSSTAWEIGVLLTTPPSIKRRSPIATGGKSPGIDADAATASTAGPPDRRSSRPSSRSNANKMKRDRRIGEVIEVDVPPDQPPQLAIGHQMIAPAAHTADERAQA